MVAVVLPAFSFGQSKLHLTKYVNPLIGTTALTDSAELGYNPPWRTWNGLLAPAATVPFGMVQAVPVTTYGSGSGYEYEVSTIKAIAQTSGTQWGKLNIPINGDHLPMHRAAEPDEIAGVALFLAGKDASYITGQVIVVDGGLTITF